MKSIYPLKERILFHLCDVTGLSIDRVYRSWFGRFWRNFWFSSSGKPINRPR